MKQITGYKGAPLYTELEVSDIAAVLHTAQPTYGRDQYGYGRKIPLANMVVLTTGQRRYRVYASCFSNCATLYIVQHGKRIMCETALNDFNGGDV
jgi:hypothetical protein